MNGSAEELVLDENGVCNFCHGAQREFKMAALEMPYLKKWLAQIKRDGSGKEYDCLIGLSGGVDSSTVLHHAVKAGLHPLCFTMDNGYNDPRADANVLQMVEKLRVPLYRYVLDLNKFRDLQSAYLKAGVINVEATYDHLLMAATFEMCRKYGIKWVLSGGNVATESVMPPSWSYTSQDLVNMKDIYWKMTGKKLKESENFPLCSTLKFNIYKWFYGIKTLYLLDFLDYNREKSIEFLQKEYMYNAYGEKHCENTFTWWYQNFYLFQKFGIDKRLAHCSSLINSDQMTRQEGKELTYNAPVYPELGIEQKVMSYPKRRHEDFKQDKWFPRISKLIKFLRKLGLFKRLSPLIT